MPVRVNRTNPCTGDSIALDTTLSLDVIAQVEGESAEVAVTAILTTSDSAHGSAQVVPIREQFGFSAPLYGDPTTVRQLRTQLVGQTRPVTLTVALQHRVGDSDKLIVEPSTIWLTCANDPVEVSRADLNRPGQHGR